jgi:hypothetical protein
MIYTTDINRIEILKMLKLGQDNSEICFAKLRVQFFFHNNNDSFIYLFTVHLVVRSIITL